MKKGKQTLVMVLLLVLMPQTIWGSDEGAKSNALLIDNVHVYENMDKSYQKGYTPIVKRGVATLVLPLIAAEPESIGQDQIRVTFQLGDPASAPFQFKNYDKTVKLKSHSVNNDRDKTDSYLVETDIPLIAEPVAGRYPVVITASGQWVDGTPFSQDFSLYVTIQDGVNPSITPTPEPTLEEEMDAEPASEAASASPVETEELPKSQAKILLESCLIDPSPVMSGEEFRISATFRNTSETQSLDNVKITVTGESADIIPMGDVTGGFYFKKIANQETVTLDLKMKTAANVKAEPHKIKFAIEYEGDKATAYTAAEEAVLQIAQPVRLQFDEPQIAKEVNAGDTLSVSLNVMNLGLSMVHNVRMSVEAKGLLPEETAFIGNIESGAAKKGDLYVFVNTLATGSETAESEDKYGTTKGKVILLYEDEYQKEYREEFEFSTKINPPVILTEEEPKEEKETNQGQWWISILAVAGMIAVIVSMRTYARRRQERIRRQEEEPDDFRL